MCSVLYLNLTRPGCSVACRTVAHRRGVDGYTEPTEWKKDAVGTEH